MIINLVIVLLIFIVIFNCIVYNNQYKCPKYILKINYIRASRLPGSKYSERVEIDTINLKLDRDVPCGIYKVKTLYGYGILIVAKNNKRIGYLNMKDTKLYDNVNLFDVWDIERINTDDNQFINTYNRGCC